MCRGAHVGSEGPLELAEDDTLTVLSGGWHGFEGRDLDAIFVYLGAPSLEASGYEPRHDAATQESK